MANETLKKITTRAKLIRRKRPGMKYTNAVKEASKQLKREGKIGVAKKKKWIQKAVNPRHKGYCSPVTKKTCTPRRKALAERFKKHQIGKVKIRKRVGGISKIKQLENQLGREYVKFYNETTIRGTDLSRKRLAEIKRQLKAAKKK